MSHEGVKGKMSAIEIDNLSYCYRDNGECCLALEDINLDIPSGEFVCLIGHSGCGKSTLLSLLAGLAKPTTGSIKVDGQPINGPSLDRAMVFQHYSLFPWMKVAKNVAFSASQAAKKRGNPLSKEEVGRRVEFYLEKVGMLDSASKYPFQLSGGMQQRVAIARTLAMESDILLLDEPFGALDARSRSDLQRLLVELWQNASPRKTVVFVTHDLNEALLLATKVVAMRPKHIARVFDVDFPRPRDIDDLVLDPGFRRLREELMSIFYLDKGAGTCGMQPHIEDDASRGILNYADIQGGA